MTTTTGTSKRLKEFADELLELPWGALAKSELEFRVFQLLSDTENIDLNRTDVQLAQDLATTQARIRSLRFKSQQRKYRKKDEWAWDELLSTNHVTLHSVSSEGAEMILYAKDPFLKEVLTEKLREGSQPVLVRSTLTPGHLRVDGVNFWMKVLDDGTLSENEYEKIQQKIESTFPEKDTLFKGIFKKADKAAGAANVASFALTFFGEIGKHIVNS